jgi:hypothetical protein
MPGTICEGAHVFPSAIACIGGWRLVLRMDAGFARMSADLIQQQFGLFDSGEVGAGGEQLLEFGACLGFIS